MPIIEDNKFYESRRNRTRKIETVPANRITSFHLALHPCIQADYLYPSGHEQIVFKVYRLIKLHRGFETTLKFEYCFQSVTTGVSGSFVKLGNVPCTRDICTLTQGRGD